jgi:hypothetical protein
MPGLRTLIAVVALGAALAAPAAAQAGAGSAYGDYSSDGKINGCDYSGGQLQNAIGSIPTDIAQYDPRFKNALNNALAQRAAGCGSAATTPTAKQQTTAGHGKKAGAPAPSVVAAPAVSGSTDLRTDHGFPAALAVLAAMVALIILGTALVYWRRGRTPRARRGSLFSFFTDYYWGIRDTIGR